MIDAALQYRRAGLCVLPAIRADKRPAVSRWKEFQRVLPTEEQLTAWCRRADALCLVCGAVSGNLEMLDFDVSGEAFGAWAAKVQEHDAPLLDRLVIEQSPSGGWHVVYRCQEHVCGNIKLAERKQMASGPEAMTIAGKTYQPRCDTDGQWYVLLTLIETRGEGGLFLCSPTPGYELVQGDLAALPVLTPVERETLLEAAWALNEYWPQPVDGSNGGWDGSLRPGDDYNQRGDIRAILQRHGWTLAKPAGSDGNEHWRRPGKATGTSATRKNGVFYVFSTNAAPFEAGRGYSPFAVYTLLEHGGDFRGAAKALQRLGYGPETHNSLGQPQPNGRSQSQTRLSETSPLQHIRSRAITVELSSVVREDLTWLWPGRIPQGKLTLLAGDPGLGKSFVTLDIASRVSCGRAWPDSPLLAAPVGKVILLNAEDDLADTIAPRLDNMGADDKHIIAIKGVHTPEGSKHFSLQTDLAVLADALASEPETRLIVIDPIDAYLDRIDSHKSAEVRGVLAPLAELASRYKVAIVAVTHLSKTGGTKAIYRAMGSLAFAAAARSVWMIAKDQNDLQRRLFLPAKLNIAQPPSGLAFTLREGRVVWDMAPICMHADDALAAEAVTATSQHQRRQATAWLREHLTADPTPAGEIIEQAQAAGITKSTLHRAFKELGGQTRKQDNCWLWSLP